MKRLLYTILAATIAVSFSACSSKKAEQKRENILFGINADNYNIERHTVERGDSWSKILENYGIGTQKVLRLDQLTKNICPLRTIRAISFPIWKFNYFCFMPFLI